MLVDQTKLPQEEVYLVCRDHRMVAEAIRRLAVGRAGHRVAAAFGVVLGAEEIVRKNDLVTGLEEVFTLLAATRPTAVNLFGPWPACGKLLGRNREAPRSIGWGAGSRSPSYLPSGY